MEKNQKKTKYPKMKNFYVSKYEYVDKYNFYIIFIILCALEAYKTIQTLVNGPSKQKIRLESLETH